MICDKNGQKKDIFPIFSNNENIEIIGYGYKYKQGIDYANAIDYTKYLYNEKLINNLSLFIYYEKIKNKICEKFEKYYLINFEFMNNIKIENDYKSFYDILNDNIQKLKFSNDKKKNIYSLMNTIPIEFLEESYSNNKKKNKSQFNTSVEPLMIIINYFDNINQKINSLYIYNNFEIINKEIIKSLIDISEDKCFLCECFFEKGKIIINIPKNLNNKIISIIGSLDNCYHNFILEYILIYNNEKNRTKHFKDILGNLDNYLKNLQLYNNNAPITIGENYDIIGTIIKYGTDYDNNLNTDYNNLSTDDNIIKMDNNNGLNDKGKKSPDGNKNTLKNNFKSCPNIGLQNIGATCYMNSTLQCFCHIEKFVEFFKYTKILKNKKEKLSFSFKILIDNLIIH